MLRSADMRRRAIQFICLCVIFLSVGTITYAVEFAGGTGTPADPYQVATAEQLISIGSDPALLDKHFVMVSDIDLDPNLTGGKVFRSPLFALSTGSLDGMGHRILNLHMVGWNHDPASKRGLGTDALIRNLAIENASVESGSIVLAYRNEGFIVNCSVKGTISATGLITENRGHIINCSVDGDATSGCRLAEMNAGTILYSHVKGGTVEGAGLVRSNTGTIMGCYADEDIYGTEYAGGLVGVNAGTISRCYAVGNVSTTAELTLSHAGGLVGINAGTISDCYATGDVFARFYAGGLVGSLDGGSISRSYATGRGGAGLVGGGGIAESSYFLSVPDAGPIDNGCGIPLTDVEMRHKESFVGWDFVGDAVDGSNEVWMVPSDSSYPLLRCIETPEFAGTGSRDDPYLIESAHQLTAICHDLGGHYRLARDIDLQGESFSQAIVAQFWGHFDGNGHAVSNFILDGDGHMGLFGVLRPQATVTDLTLGATILIGQSGTGWSGALAAHNDGEVISCSSHTTITVLGRRVWFLGGLIGVNELGNVKSCSVHCVIENGIDPKGVYWASYCGGIAGSNKGVIAQCHASSYTNGDLVALGGLVGGNEGSISNCYADGYLNSHHCKSGGTSTKGDSFLGGLVGENSGGIANCYASATVAAPPASGGLVGKDSGGSITCSYFLAQANGGGPDNGLGGVLSDTQMREQASFNSWDFESIWILYEGGNYPHLRWESAPLGQ
jgi:hypothetical protein